MRRLATAFLFLAVLSVLTTGAFAQVNTTVYDVQKGVHAAFTELEFDSVVVTAIAQFGLWIQELKDSTGLADADTSTPYSGVWCYTGSTPAVSRGDLVTVVGRYEEYFGVTEINVAASGAPSAGVHLLGAAPFTPVPRPLACQDVQTGSATQEQWEGVYISLDSVRVINNTLGFNEYSFREIDGDSTALTDTTRAEHDIGPPPVIPLPNVGDVIIRMRGPMHYSFGEARVAIESINDIQFPLPPPNVLFAYAAGPSNVDVQFDVPIDSATAVDPFNYFLNKLSEFPSSATLLAPDKVRLSTSSMTGNDPVPEILDVSGVENNEGTPMTSLQSVSFVSGVSDPSFVQTSLDSTGSSQVVNLYCTVRGIVTGDNTNDYNQRYYIEEMGGDTLSGIFVFDRIFFVDRGDSVVLAGQILEFAGKTEVDDPIFLVNYGQAVTGIPGPDTVAVNQVNDPANLSESEKWEGVFVAIENVTVVQGQDVFGEWRIVDGGGDTLIVDDDGAYTLPFPNNIGHQFSLLRGCMDYAFGTRRIQPRNDDDLIGFDPTDAGDEIPGAGTTELYNNIPNPFNPSTQIRYRLERNTHVKLRVYDARGALITTLVDGVQAGGQTYSVTWNGIDAHGRRVASGVYFYSLQVEESTFAKKMVLLK